MNAPVFVVSVNTNVISKQLNFQKNPHQFSEFGNSFRELFPFYFFYISENHKRIISVSDLLSTLQ